MIVKRVRAEGRTRRSGELFVGSHDYQSIVGSESAQFRVAELTFRDGERTKLHVHDSEQLIVIASGRGIVATAEEEHEIGVGDYALIPKEEPHWHGARPGGQVTLLSVLGPHKTRLAPGQRS